MTIDEAIAYDEELREGLSQEMVLTYGTGLQLSIEALKYYQKVRVPTIVVSPYYRERPKIKQRSR